MLDIDFIIEDDLQLATFIEERNQQSMDYFYEKYSPALYGIIYRITNNKHLSEEGLTATFVKALNDIATFPDSGTSSRSLWLAIPITYISKIPESIYSLLVMLFPFYLSYFVNPFVGLLLIL
jgi:hypothetical protein